ncbi:ferredoxin [Embleya hyalina]|uniref:Ferredoxin n=1 Tax=Embleya hyalina TaxID=516124 RepID=A0A401YF16_9ACTN|nr:ferredoxin [Embleya hyalina]GCD93192.1 ferredoxin [Embleya hyalina]
MRVTVDMTVCESHGQCVFAAPDVFAFDDEDRLIYEPAPPAALARHVRTGALMCPARAVTIAEDGA